jgi:hypothetical protein
VRILLIGSDNPWRMEAAVERAMQRAGHTTLLIDDRRMKRLIGWNLTQLWAKWQAQRCGITIRSGIATWSARMSGTSPQSEKSRELFS